MKTEIMIIINQLIKKYIKKNVRVRRNDILGLIYFNKESRTRKSSVLLLLHHSRFRLYLFTFSFNNLDNLTLLATKVVIPRKKIELKPETIKFVY